MSKFILVFLLLVGTPAAAQWEYFGQEVPTSLAPRPFAPYLLSASDNERDFAIAPDGKSIYYTIQYSANRSIIVYSEYANNQWTLPRKASFSGVYADLEPAFSLDGLRLYFSSNRSVGGNQKDFDIWYVERVDGGPWSEPALAGGGKNSAENEFYPSLTRTGNLYFTATRAGGKGGEDIWVSRFENGRFLTPQVLPDAINSIHGEYNAFIDPDEQFIYFSSDGRADEVGGGDLYISRKDTTGNWMPARRLNFNTEKLDYCPYVSPDGAYLFFTSERDQENPLPTNPLDLISVLKYVLDPDNNKGNIYWARR